MKIKTVSFLALMAFMLLCPYNVTKYITDSSGEIKMSKIERKSVLFNYGTF